MAKKRLTSWDDCQTEADYRALIAKKSQPDARGRYHCVACGKFADPGSREGNHGEPRCEDHDYSYPGGMNRDEYEDLYRWANQI